jgi:hypothetical protein
VEAGATDGLSLIRSERWWLRRCSCSAAGPDARALGGAAEEGRGARDGPHRDEEEGWEAAAAGVCKRAR